MTEREWLASTAPLPMLEFLRDSGTDSDRKLRLFAAVCCRRAWHLLDTDGKAVVETSERFADGAASHEDLQKAIWAKLHHQHAEARSAVDSAAIGDWRRTVALLAAAFSCPSGSVSSPAGLERRVPIELRIQAALLRDIFGPLPFRESDVDRDWRTPIVLSLAQATYEERTLPAGTLDPDRLAVLADALEDAGCADIDILTHLRSTGPHARGCWPLDLLLARS